MTRQRAQGRARPNPVGLGAVIGGPHLSVVIPCFNEEGRLPDALRSIIPYLAARGAGFELILVDDGSTDGTLAVMRAAAMEHESVRVVAVAPNQGKGWALAAGVLVSSGEEVLVSDCDFSTPVTELPKLELALQDGADVAIASRAKRASRVEVSQPIYRVLMGKVFNLIVQAVLLPGLWDTQCGFKLFRGEVARDLFARIRTGGFGYDIEVLYLARRDKHTIAEVPVRWLNSAPTKVAAVRHSAEMFLDIFRIRLRH